MTWQTNVPRGDLLPKNERTRFTGNWNYIETEMQDDHFWDEDANNDGHHKKIEVRNLTDAIGAANVDASGNPNVLSTNMTGYFYARPKTATEAPTLQITEPYFISMNGATRIINQLGFRALVQFEVGTSPGFAITIRYSHNVASAARNAPGMYTINFTTAIPTNNYIAFGTAMRRTSSGSNSLLLSPVISNTKTDAFNTTFFRFNTTSTSDAPTDPFIVSVAIVGG